jgi:hypothetical protein
MSGVLPLPAEPSLDDGVSSPSRSAREPLALAPHPDAMVVTANTTPNEALRLRIPSMCRSSFAHVLHGATT